MKRLPTTLFFLFLIGLGLASELSIENIRVINRGPLGEQVSVSFDLSWNHTWRNDRNHDAAWVFMKYKFPNWYRPAKIAQQGHRVLKKRIVDSPDPVLEVPEDGVGFFIYLSEPYRGEVNYKLEIVLDTAGIRGFNYRYVEDFQVYGIEMVYVPEGPFYIGDPDEKSVSYAAMYQSGRNGEFGGPMQIKSEAAIEVGPQRGHLYYQVQDSIYQGDQRGPIPASFPKGFRAFYCMKYEISQGLYTDFLNCLYKSDSHMRNPIGGLNYYKNRGTIKIQNGHYHTDHPQRPMNYISWVDGCALADWAGLRPMTELEFSKAARGPLEPGPGEFVWGTDNYEQLERYVNKKGDLILTNGITEADLSDENRPVLGASYYWVMDLNGSVWEKVITIGDSVGRAFTGSHGDGMTRSGEATNPDWPDRDTEQGGYGYRGGGYYEVGTPYGDFNPHSPVAYRRYGAWSGGPRSIAYGFRCVRTAD